MLISYRLAIRILCLILAVLPGTAAHGESAKGQEDSMAQAHFKKGLTYFQRGEYPKAIKELEIARDRSSGPCIRCSKGIALSYFLSERFEEAVGAYEELFELEPDQLTYLRRLLQVYDKVGTPEKAVDACRTFLENSNDIEIYNELGVRLLALGSGLPTHQDQAAAAFRKAFDRLSGRSNLVRRNLAEALWRSSSEQEALSVLDGLAEEYEERWNWLLTVEPSPELEDRVRRIRSTWSIPIRTVAPAAPAGDFVENKSCFKDSGTLFGPEPMFVKGDVRSPRKLSGPQLEHSKKDLKARVQGVVVIQLIIDEHGCVRATRAVHGVSSGLIDQAVKTIRKWRFQPATLDGEPVAVYYQWTVNFRLP